MNTRSSSPGSFIRSVAVVTLTCFLYTSVIAQGLSAVMDRQAATARLTTALDAFLIPSTYGRVTDSRYFGSKKVVIAIQDLHCHSEVQKNISQILALLDAQYRLHTVCIEGASGTVNTSWLGAIKDKKVRQGIIDGLMAQGRLTGAEHYSVTARRPDLLCGLENKAVYTANLERLGTMLKERDKIDAALASIESNTRALKNSYYNAKQVKLERLTEKYAAGKLDAKRYYAFLDMYCRRLGIDIGEYGSILEFLGLAERAKRLNYGRVARQMQEFVGLLKQQLPYNTFKLLAERTQEFRNVDLLSLYLGAIVRDQKLTAALVLGYPDLNGYLAYVDAMRRINPLDLVREEKKLARQINIGLADNQSERDIAFLVDYFSCFRDYYSNRISAEDYGYFGANLGRYKLLWGKYADNERLSAFEPYFGLFNDFYRVNVERNGWFIRNAACDGTGQAGADQLPYGDNAARIMASLKEADIQVAITGGFHTPGFTKILADRKISYLVITPNVTQGTDAADAVYEKIAREQSKILSQAFALLALSQNPASERAKEIAEILIAELRGPADMGRIEEEANAAIKEALAAGDEGMTVEFGIKEDQSGKYRFWLVSKDKNSAEAKTVYFLYNPAEKEMAEKIRPIDITLIGASSSKKMSPANRAGMALASGAAAVLGISALSLNALLSWGAGIAIAGFYLVQWHYLSRACAALGTVPDLKNADERLAGVVAGLPDKLQDALSRTGCIADPDPDRAIAAHFRDGKIYVNLELMEDLQKQAWWLTAIIFSHEIRHAWFETRLPWLAARAGWLEELVVSWGDIIDAVCFFLFPESLQPIRREDRQKGKPALIEVTGDGDNYKYFNPALLPDGSLIARRVLRETDTSRFHRSELVRLETQPGDKTGLRFVSGAKLVDNGEDPRIMFIGGRLGMTYVVPFDDGRKWRSAFVWVDGRGKPVSDPVFLGRPGTNSKNTYIAETGDGSGRVAVFDRANTGDGKPAVQMYLFENIDDALHPSAGYWEEHPLKESTVLEAGDDWSHAGFNTVVQRPGDSFVIALVHLTKLVSDTEKYYHTAVVLLDKATMQPLGRPVIIHDATKTQLSSKGDVAGVIYEIGAQIVNDTIVSYAGVGDGSIARFEEPVAGIVSKFWQGQEKRIGAAATGRYGREASTGRTEQRGFHNTLPGTLAETIIFPLAGSQFAGLWWATVGFAAAHAIAAWRATAKDAGKEAGGNQFFIVTLKNFAVHLALSAIFVLPYFLFDVIPATAVSVAVHAAYNSLLETGIMPEWLPSASVSGKNGKRGSRRQARESESRIVEYVGRLISPQPQEDGVRKSETYLAGLGDNVEAFDATDHGYAYGWIKKKVDSGAWPSDSILLNFDYDPEDSPDTESVNADNWAGCLKKEGKIGQYWWVSAAPAVHAVTTPNTEVKLNDAMLLPATEKPVILSIDLDYFLSSSLPADRSDRAAIERRIDALVALLTARKYNLIGVNIARSPDKINTANSLAEFVVIRLCGRLNLNHVFSGIQFNGRITEITYSDGEYLSFEYEKNRITGVRESSPAGLMRALEEKDPYMRIAACRALGQAKDVAAAGALERLIVQEKSAPRVNKQVLQAAYDAVRSLGREPDESVLPDRSQDIAAVMKSLGINEAPGKDTIFGKAIAQWAKEHRLFLDYHPDYIYDEAGQRLYNSLMDSARSWSLGKVQEYVLGYAKGIGEQDAAKRWIENLTHYVDRANAGENRQTVYSIKRDYLIGRKGPHALKGTDSPFAWAVRGVAFRHVRQEREGKLFGVTDIREMKLEDLSIWPVDEQGNLLNGLLEWMNVKNAVPPVEYYRARKCSLRQFKPAPIETGMPLYVQGSLFEEENDDAKTAKSPRDVLVDKESDKELSEIKQKITRILDSSETYGSDEKSEFAKEIADICRNAGPEQRKKIDDLVFAVLEKNAFRGRRLPGEQEIRAKEFVVLPPFTIDSLKQFLDSYYESTVSVFRPSSGRKTLVVVSKEMPEAAKMIFGHFARVFGHTHPRNEESLPSDADKISTDHMIVDGDDINETEIILSAVAGQLKLYIAEKGRGEYIEGDENVIPELVKLGVIKTSRNVKKVLPGSVPVNQLLFFGASSAVLTAGHVIFGVYAYLYVSAQRDGIIRWLRGRGLQRLATAADILLLDLSTHQLTRRVASYLLNTSMGLSVKITGVPATYPVRDLKINPEINGSKNNSVAAPSSRDSLMLSRESLLMLTESRVDVDDLAGAVNSLNLGIRSYGVDFAQDILERVPILAALIAQMNLQEIVDRLSLKRVRDAEIIKEFAQKIEKVQPVSKAEHAGMDGALNRPHDDQLAFGFSYEEITRIVTGYLEKSPLISGLMQLQSTALDLEEMAASIVKHIFTEIKGIEVLSDEESDALYGYEKSVIDEKIRAFQYEEHAEMSKYRIKTEIVRGDLRPTGKNRLGYATVILTKDGGLILRVTEGFLKGTRGREPPEMLNRLVRHEFSELMAFFHPESDIYGEFERYIFERGLAKNVDSFHSFFQLIEPDQVKLFDFGMEMFERERLAIRISVDPETQSLLQQISKAIIRLLTSPHQRLVFELPADVLMIGGGSGTGAVVGGLLEHFANVHSVVSFMDNGGSSGEIMTDVAAAWQREKTDIKPSKDAVPVQTIVHPGDLMSAIVGGVPEQWKRDLLTYRFEKAEQARHMLEDARAYVFTKYKDKIHSGEISREKVNAFADSLVPIVEWVDTRWVNTGLLRLAGVNHNLQNMVYFGTVFMEGAFQPGWVIPVTYNRAIDRIIRLLGSNTPALPASLQSFNELRFVAELPGKESLRIKDKDKNKIVETETQEITGQENITGVEHRLPIDCVKFLNKDSVPVAGAANPEVLRMIRTSKFIVIGPGSVYTSILPNLMSEGVVEELHKAKARGVPVIFLFNTTQDIETSGHTFKSLIASIEKSISLALHEDYKLENFVSHVVFNDATLDEEYLKEFSAQEIEQMAKQKTDPSRIHEQGKYAIGLFPDMTHPDEAVALLREKGIQPVAGPFAAFKQVPTRSNKEKQSYHYIVPLLAFFFTLIASPAAIQSKFIAADVDETIAPVKMPVSKTMAQNIAATLKAGYMFALVSGNTRESIFERVIVPLKDELGADVALLKNLPIFANNGSEMLEYNPVESEYELVQSRVTDMAEMIGGGHKIEMIESIINETINKYGIESRHGAQIEIRHNELGSISQVTFFPAGINMTKDEKDEYDRAGGRQAREEYAADINGRLRKSGIPASAKVAGKTSIDITPLGVDKAYAIKLLAEHYAIEANQVIFFGDSFGVVGNDYPAATEAGMVVNVGAHIKDDLNIPTFTIEDSGPEGAERFLSVLNEVRKFYETEQALGFTRAELVALISGAIKNADPLLDVTDELQAAAVGIVDAMFAETISIHGTKLAMLNSRPYKNEVSALREATLAQPDLLRKLGVVPNQKNVVIKTVKGDLIPVGADNEGLGFATLEINSGKAIFYVTEKFWKESRVRAPPRIFDLLARHELNEYVYRKDNPGKSFNDFHQLTTTEYADLFDFAKTIIVKQLYPRHLSDAIGALLDMINGFPTVNPQRKPIVMSMDRTGETLIPAIDNERLLKAIGKYFGFDEKIEPRYTAPDMIIGRPFNVSIIDAVRKVLDDLRSAAPEDILFLPDPGHCHITVAARTADTTLQLSAPRELGTLRDKISEAISTKASRFNGTLDGVLKLMPDGVIILEVTDQGMNDGISALRGTVDADWYKPAIVHVTLGRIRSLDYTDRQIRAIQAILQKHNIAHTLKQNITVESVKFGQFREQAQEEFNVQKIDLSGTMNKSMGNASEQAFAGKYTVKIDEKYRLGIPSGLKRAFGNGKVYLRAGRDGALLIYNEAGFQAEAARVNDIRGTYRLQIQRQFFSSVFSAQLDSQGRVVLEKDLRRKLNEKVAFKQGEELRLVGKGDHIEALPARERQLADLRKELVGIITDNIENRINQPGRDIKIDRELRPQFNKVIADNGNDNKFIELLSEALKTLNSRQDVQNDAIVHAFVAYLINEAAKYRAGPTGHYLSRFEGEKKLHELLLTSRAGHLALSDMDGLGNMNALYGKQLMNFVLERYLTVLNKEAEKNGGILIRWGGDEWMVYLPPKLGIDEARAVFNSIRQAGTNDIRGSYSVARTAKSNITEKMLRELAGDKDVMAVSEVGTQKLVLFAHDGLAPSEALNALNARLGTQLEIDLFNGGNLLAPTLSMGAVNLQELPEARQENITTMEFIEKVRPYLGRAEEKAKETKDALVYGIISASPHAEGTTILEDRSAEIGFTPIAGIPTENVARDAVDARITAGEDVTVNRVIPSYQGDELGDASMVSRRGNGWMRFKAVNSAYGLFGGDRIIQLLYRELMREFKDQDIPVFVARGVPDEYILYFRGNMDEHIEARLLDKLENVKNAVNAQSIVKVTFDAAAVDTGLLSRGEKEETVTAGKMFEKIDQIKSVIGPVHHGVIEPLVSAAGRSPDPVRLFVYDTDREHQIREIVERQDDEKRKEAFARLSGNGLSEAAQAGIKEPVTRPVAAKRFFRGEKISGQFWKIGSNASMVARSISQVLNTSMNVAVDRDRAWMMNNAPVMLNKPVVEVATDINVQKLAAMNRLGAKAFGITYSEQLRGMHLGNVLVPLKGKSDPVRMQLRAEVRRIPGTAASAVVLNLYSKTIADENKSLGAEEKRLREMQLLGRGALAACTQIEQDSVLKERLAGLGLPLEDGFYPAVVQLSGKGSVFASPEAIEDEFIDSFGRTLFVYDPEISGGIDKMPESICHELGVNRHYLGRICSGSFADLNKLGLAAADKVIGDADLVKAYPWLAGLIYDRGSYPEEMKEKVKAYMAAIYAPGVINRSGESWTTGLKKMGERIVPSALTGHNYRVGKLADVEDYVKEKLIPAGAGIVQFVSLQAPGSSSLYAGDQLLIDWTMVEGVEAMIAHGMLRNEEISGSASDRKEYVDRAAVAEAEFVIAEKVCENLKKDGRLAEYRDFAAANSAWLDKYAREAADSRLSGTAGDTRALQERYCEIYKVMQWIFGRQLRETVRAVARNREKAIFSIDMNGQDPHEVLGAIQYWFDFGFEGVQINVGDSSVIDESFISSLRQIVRRAHADPFVSIKLPSTVPASVIKMIRNSGFEAMRNMSKFGPEAKVTAGEGVEIDSFGEVPADVNGAADYYIRAVRSAMLSDASFVFFRMGMLWGEEVDIDNEQVRLSYRVPAAGKARHRFDSDFLRRLREIGVLSRAGYDDAFREGLWCPAARLIDKSWFKSLNGTENRIQLHYEDGSTREVSGTGLHCLLKVSEVMRFDKKNGRFAREYVNGDIFKKLYEICSQPGISDGERLALFDHIKDIEKDAASTESREDKLACTEQLFGFVRGMMENAVESRYAAFQTSRVVNEMERRALRSLFLVADSLGIDTEELEDLESRRAENIAKIRSSVVGSLPSAGGMGLFEALAYSNELMDRHEDRAAAEVEREIRTTINPILGEIVQNGTLADSVMVRSPHAMNDKESQRAAIAELFRILDALAERKVPTTEELLNNTMKPAIESFKGMFAAG